MTTRSGRAGLRAVDDAIGQLIDQLMEQFREARAEHNVAAAKIRAEFRSFTHKPCLESEECLIIRNFNFRRASAAGSL